jgi:hypothetical protein
LVVPKWLLFASLINVGGGFHCLHSFSLFLTQACAMVNDCTLTHFPTMRTPSVSLLKTLVFFLVKRRQISQRLVTKTLLDTAGHQIESSSCNGEDFIANLKGSISWTKGLQRWGTGGTRLVVLVLTSTKFCSKEGGGKVWSQPVQSSHFLERV